ncbi:MAG: hypothetical protein AAF490_02310 [Chloroflexota bacterium]
MSSSTNQKAAIRLALVGLILLTLWLYAPAIHFGFWWDDPVWYSHMIGKLWWQQLLPEPDFQYFRPGSMFYVSRFLNDNGTYAAVALHWMQIGWHLLQVALSYAISRRLKLDAWTAVFVATIVALFPFSYQATAWAAPNQPMAAAFQGGAWLFFLLGYQRRQNGFYFWSILLFFLALTLQESSAALTFVPLLLFLTVQLQKAPSWQTIMQLVKRPFYSGLAWPFAYPVATAVFVLIWLQVPRQSGITELTLDPRTGLYLLQGVAFPLLGRVNGYDPAFQMLDLTVWLIIGLTVAVLLGLAIRHQRGWIALMGLAWLLMSIVPAIVGLRFSYVTLASRLLHSGGIGIALLWACALSVQNGRLPFKLIGRLILIGIAIQSVLLLRQFDQLYSVGTVHLQEAIETMSEDNGRYLFINFPDRYAPNRAPYPIGYWGMTLAPVVVDLDTFPPVLTGTNPDSISRSMPWINQAERENGPFVVDMRGAITQPNEMAQLALENDAVLLTRYQADGTFTLENVGHFDKNQPSDCLATYGEMICLQAVDIKAQADGMMAQFRWQTSAPVPPNVTIFAHLGLLNQPPLLQLDGDSWQGSLPLADWPLNTAVIDNRPFSMPEGANDLVLQIGVYDRVTGERLIGVDGEKRPLANNAYVLDVGE